MPPTLPAPPPVCARVALPDALAGYAALVRTGKLDALARLYGRTGVMVGAGGAPLTGEGEVERYLAGFSEYRVTDERITPDTVKALPGLWRVTGRFSQRGTTPDGTAYAAQGGLAVDWRCTRAGWRVARMVTLPGEQER